MWRNWVLIFLCLVMFVFMIRIVLGLLEVLLCMRV